MARKIDNIISLKQLFDSGLQYFFYQSPRGAKYVFPVEEIVPSQYIRQVIAAKIGAKSKWDWRSYPGLDEFDATMKRLKDKF